MNETPVYLGVGSNLGDREANCRAAVGLLANEIAVDAVSSLYETAPYGVTDQPAFLNLVLAGRTTLSPHQLLALCKQVERDIGRRPTYRWGPRVVDIDVLLFGDRREEWQDLTIPHRDMLNRPFVLIPLAEIAPDVTHPTARRTIGDLAAGASRDGIRQVLSWW